MTVRTEDEADDVQTGQSLGTYSVLDLSYNTKFFVGGVVGQAVDVVSHHFSRLIIIIIIIMIIIIIIIIPGQCLWC